MPRKDKSLNRYGQPKKKPYGQFSKLNPDVHRIPQLFAFPPLLVDWLNEYRKETGIAKTEVIIRALRQVHDLDNTIFKHLDLSD